MSLLAISDTHKREKANLLATKSPTFGSHSSANGHVPHAFDYNDCYSFSTLFTKLQAIATCCVSHCRGL